MQNELKQNELDHRGAYYNSSDNELISLCVCAKCPSKSMLHIRFITPVLNEDLNYDSN